MVAGRLVADVVMHQCSSLAVLLWALWSCDFVDALVKLESCHRYHRCHLGILAQAEVFHCRICLLDMVAVAEVVLLAAVVGFFFFCGAVILSSLLALPHRATRRPVQEVRLLDLLSCHPNANLCATHVSLRRSCSGSLDSTHHKLSQCGSVCGMTRGIVVMPARCPCQVS